MLGTTPRDDDSIVFPLRDAGAAALVNAPLAHAAAQRLVRERQRVRLVSSRTPTPPRARAILNDGDGMLLCELHERRVARHVLRCGLKVHLVTFP